MEPYSETPLNVALRNERKAEEFINTWRFNHAARCYQKAADNIARAIKEERANNLVPSNIIDSLEEQKKFYLNQEQVCQNRRSHVGHLFKDKGRLSYNLSKQAEHFAQAHSLLIHSQNSLQQQQKQQRHRQASIQTNNGTNLEQQQIDDTYCEREHSSVSATKNNQLLVTDRNRRYQVSRINTKDLIVEPFKSIETVTPKDFHRPASSSSKQQHQDINTEKSNYYNITNNPLSDYCAEEEKPKLIVVDKTTSTITTTTANKATSKALVLRPPESSLAVMALPKRTGVDKNLTGPQRTSDGLPSRSNHSKKMGMFEEEPEDYDLGDKYNGGSIAYRNLLFEINRLFSEHNTLIDNLSTATEKNFRRQQKNDNFPLQPNLGNASELHLLDSQPRTSSQTIANDRNDNDILSQEAFANSRNNNNINNRQQDLANDQQELTDTLGKLRWNQCKLRNIISDLVQRLEKTSEDNERLRCQIMMTRPDSRLDQICPLPPLEPPTLQY